MRILVSILTFFISGYLQAQEMLINDGSEITVEKRSDLTIKGDYESKNGAWMSNRSVVRLSGDWINNGGNTALYPRSGRVEFAGLTNQSIRGTDTSHFHTLDIAPGLGELVLERSAVVGDSLGQLLLGSRILDLNSQCLIIRNPDSGTIRRSTGYIISETEPGAGYGWVHWEIDSALGSYSIPFGTQSGDFIPLEFQVFNSGSGSGALRAATYPTDPSLVINNRPLPAGVTHLNHSGTENAAFTLDRFWIFDQLGYSTEPELNLTLQYRDEEWNSSGSSTNSITEANLRAQHWTGSAWSVPIGSLSTALNQITLSDPGLWGVWTLADNASPLPVELLYFEANRISDRQALLTWETAVEVENSGFEVWRKQEDQIDWEYIAWVEGKGNSSARQAYTLTDIDAGSKLSFYKLIQVDFDGSRHEGPIRLIDALPNQTDWSFSAFPNPTRNSLAIKVDGVERYTLHLHDAYGRKILSKDPLSESTVIEMQGLNPGMYMLSIEAGNKKTKTIKVVKVK